MSNIIILKISVQNVHFFSSFLSDALLTIHGKNSANIENHAMR